MIRSYRDRKDIGKIWSALRKRETERVDSIMSETRMLTIYSIKELPVVIIHSERREVTSPFETYNVIGREEDIRRLEQEAGIESKLRQE